MQALSALTEARCHPLYLGMFIVLWATPTMTVAHLVFALLSTGYVLVGARLEEKDLEDALPQYTDYKQQVPMFIPTPGRSHNSVTTEQA